jgi:hypothetical protein
VWQSGDGLTDHPGVRFVARLAIQVLGNAVGLVVAASVLDGVSLTFAALLLDVLIFTGISVLLLPLIQKQAIRRSEALAGSSALVTCFLALVLTVWWSDGLRISGLTAWIATPVVVWAVALVLGIALPWLLLKRKVAQRRDAPVTRRGA